jgi:hypothetical protein
MFWMSVFCSPNSFYNQDNILKPIGLNKMSLGSGRPRLFGFAAGRRIGRLLLQAPVGERYYNRSTVRTVAGEIAYLIRHRFHGLFVQWMREHAAEAIRNHIMVAKKSKTHSLESLERSGHG